MVYDNNLGGEFAKYFVQDLTEPEAFTSAPADYQEMYKKFSKRILWIDDKMVPGAFQMNTAWWYAVPERDPVFLEHSHDDTSEIIGLFGTDPDDPYYQTTTVIVRAKKDAGSVYMIAPWLRARSDSDIVDFHVIEEGSTEWNAHTGSDDPYDDDWVYVSLTVKKDKTYFFDAFFYNADTLQHITSQLPIIVKNNFGTLAYDRNGGIGDVPESVTLIVPEGEPFAMWGANWSGKVLSLNIKELRNNQKLFEYHPRVVVK